MYLSRVALNTRRRDTMAALASPQRLHAAVESSFPPGLSVKGRSLWRIDLLANDTYLLVLSEQKPDFTHIVEQFGWPEADQKWETKNYNYLIDQIRVGQRWQFRLRANPAHSVKQSGDEKQSDNRGKVYAHVTARQQEQWLLERAQKNGFALTEGSFRVVHRETRRFRRHQKTITLGVATFEGVLEVTDLTLFLQALTRGIGRAKAFGCGLLTIMKVSP
ncbi:MAG: type I-E CRISPR-associated protein Cas6/Cse3/CasE [Firmicutes bacterium]|nr:type I-E CRISPR-associated protein Cas6/Cse3/CasE [Bacillota bacterium]